jgi:hypothetical protein
MCHINHDMLTVTILLEIIVISIFLYVLLVKFLNHFRCKHFYILKPEVVTTYRVNFIIIAVRHRAE